MCTINLTWTSCACQPTLPSILHTSGCGAQLLDDFNLQHEHVTVYYQETSLIVSQAVRMCACIVQFYYTIGLGFFHRLLSVYIRTCMRCTRALNLVKSGCQAVLLPAPVLIIQDGLVLLPPPREDKVGARVSL